jgi:predicted SPOUT superfamily RNA methylase MTH1
MSTSVNTERKHVTLVDPSDFCQIVQNGPFPQIRRTIFVLLQTYIVLSAFKQKAAGNTLRPTGGKQSLHERKISIAIPASVVSDTPHLREKTSKVGMIGRAAAIFKIDGIIIYPDDPKADQTQEMKLITVLLSYMETPQYLRKRLFRIEPRLRYAGILPPLRTAHHPLNRTTKQLKVGEFREGVTVSKNRDGTLVDIGVDQPAIILSGQLPVGKRVTVKIKRIAGHIEIEPVNRNEISAFWGYTVTEEKQPLGEILKKRGFDLTIATSRFGIPFSHVAEEVSERWMKAKAVLVAFGAPNQGLHEIVRQEGLHLNDIADFTVNTIPSQGTETVRTEEAVIASLAILNAQLHRQR